MNSIFENDSILKQLNEVTRIAYGEEYFMALGKLITDVTKADYTYITKINYEAQLAEPIVSYKYGIKIKNEDYPLKNTPCLTVTETCTGYYPKNVQELFPEDEFLKSINISGYLGTSVVPSGHEKPLVILTCLYENEVDHAQHHLDVLEFIAKNIEDRVERELLVTENNRQKTVLKEVHHRIKNNLQILSSLLNLEKDKITDKRAMDVINMSQGRIQAIALIHQLLHNSSGFDKLNIREYITLICEATLSNYPEGKEISTEIKCINYDLSIEEITPIGLILCELLANSIEHAFEQTPHPEIKIEFYLDKFQHLFIVSDNGIGFSRSVLQNEPSTSLGLELVKALTEQINGILTLENEQGAKISIRF